MSIIGKSLTTLGGGGMQPEIVVTSTAGTILTVSENSVVKQTYTLGASETQHTFQGLSAGHTYTVTASNGTISFSRNVYVDETAQYPVTVYPATLYYDGYDNRAVTGGWQGRGWLSGASSGYTAVAPSVSTGDDYITVKWVSTSAIRWSAGAFECINDVNLNGFTKIHILYDEFSTTGTASLAPRFLVIDRTDSGWYTDADAIISIGAVGTNQEAELDITSINTAKDIVIGCSLATTGEERTINVKRIWLE